MGGQLPQGEGNLLIFGISSEKSPPCPGMGGGGGGELGVALTPALTLSGVAIFNVAQCKSGTDDVSWLLHFKDVYHLHGEFG